MRERVAGVAIVLLAIVAASRLRLEYVVSVALPEIEVMLSLPPAAASDLETTTDRWLVRIEPAIRSLGDVVGMRGEVSASGARMTVRFRSGVDPELKTARLLADLAPLRAQLPRGARLDAFPDSGAGSRPAAYLATTSSAVRVAEELRGVDGVSEVEVWGETRNATDVRLRDEVPASAVRENIAQQMASRRLGAKVVVAARRMEDVVVPIGANVFRLDALANIRKGPAPVTRLSRLNGKPAEMLAVYRDDNVPIFRFERALARRAAELQLEVISSDAADLRRLLILLAIGAACATIVFRGAYVPLAIAASMNVAWIAGLEVDAIALIAAAIAIIGMAPLAGKDASALLCVVVLPITATLAGGSLGPTIVAPSRAFALAAVASWGAGVLAGARRRGTGRLTRRLLRNAATLILGVATASYAAFVWFGASLDPRVSGRAADRSRLYLRLTLPAGTTLEKTTASATAIEKKLRGIRGIARTWTTIEPGRATSIIEIEPRWQTPEKVASVQREIEVRVPFGSGSVIVGPSYSGSSTVGLDDLEQRPETDEEATLYRFILKSTNLDALRNAVDSAIVRIEHSGGASRDAIHPEWGATSTRLELIPRRGASPEAINAMAAALSERTLPAPSTEMSDGRILTVSAARAPKKDDDVPQAADLFATPLGGATVDSLFDRREAFVFGSLQRELGRFIVPVNVRIGGWQMEDHLKNRDAVDRALALMALDPAVSMARPSLSRWTVSKEKMRLFALVAFLPSLLFAFAAIALSSLPRALISLSAPAAALALAAPVLFLTSTTVDEVTLVAMAASLCCVAAMSIAVLRLSGAPAYSPVRAGGGAGAPLRVLRRYAPSYAITSLAAVLMFGFAAFADAVSRGGWRSPIVAATVALALGALFAAAVPTAAMIIAADARRRLSAESRAARRPAQWESLDEPPHLSIDNLTKIYRGGVRSLHRVSFELAPGVIGLLGPNGAGKTTLLRILSGLLEPTRGELRFRGVPVVAENLAAYRRHIGFLPQEFNAWPGFTAEEFLDFWAIERGMESAAERSEMIARLLEEVGLTAAAKRRVRDYSGGMRQRIGIARALIGDPPIVIVDEPTTGLDVEARAHFREVMLAIARQRIVILSTHIAGDVEATASRILLIERGSLRYDGSPDALLRRAAGRVFEDVVSESDARALSRRYSVTTRVRVREGIRIRAVVREGDDLPGAPADPTLEEAYLAVIAPREAAHTGTFAFLSQ